ncbi:hypothetical protein AT2G06908 [Arabidopsis thaliana]|uniref:Uncharacterized protein n=1 Tax=Arabidopsis thaliana TaxID=3702 RepID=F4IK79_ARATH|nr:uncharacterized protein AT2G06908 [Arabidopsis thaliana]AEC06024.1 hypothetical protein AT2G06908 [Arabidopsis thaliana]|eukprot:NP_671795.1 hypothetical protein AT2G06908 [Arabidopsis thaliana]
MAWRHVATNVTPLPHQLRLQDSANFGSNFGYLSRKAPRVRCPTHVGSAAGGANFAATWKPKGEMSQEKRAPSEKPKSGGTESKKKVKEKKDIFEIRSLITGEFPRFSNLSTRVVLLFAWGQAKSKSGELITRLFSPF